MDDAGMPLRQWSSSCRQLERLFDSNDALTALAYENAGHQERVLGMGWCKATGVFIYNPENIFTFLEKAKDTKRFVLQTVSTIYDPLEWNVGCCLRAWCQ
ncbi:hypothetical protein HPB49_007147 [Dermacentor silvarum]|uniref:Uncharacterized protein n=1 Tax=Dermacentor silvarum TaxID=543639 RepID=A0ACB8CJW5_DERSI|nr:hypothetical protein HPB49_007147 [Dermacentor silvarum]